MNKEQIFALIEQELRGTLSVIDARVLTNWVRRGRKEKNIYQEVRSILETTTEGISEIDPQTDSSWITLQNMLAKVGTSVNVLDEEFEQSKVKEKVLVIPLKSSRIRIYGVAVAVILLVIAGLLIVFPSGTPESDSGETLSSVHKEVKQFDLSDGSHVTLNSESKLEILADFNDKVRRVKLEGEAFFDITRNKEKPFFIEVRGAEAKVLGTSFTISAYPATEQVLVSVVTGHVEFSPIGSDIKIDLTPNQAGRFDLKTGKLSRMKTFAPDDAAWRQGKLVFRKVPFRIALERLEKQYDLEFIVSPDLENEPLTTTIDVNTTSEGDLLSLLKTTFQVQIKRTERRVEIMK